MNNGWECITNPNDANFPSFRKNCTQASMMDTAHVIYKVANNTGIPDYHVVNAWNLLRNNWHVAADQFMQTDNTHPNLRGHGAIAQEIYMKMSLSPEIQKR
jgi:lysophospholipase L1-like esterase